MARLIINNIVFELEDVNIAQTKQVNDILSLNTRQSNFTNTFTLPLTAKNIRSFRGLGIVGNDSNIPYIKNNAYLYSDSGECFVYNGWAVVNETAQGYKVNIYDGSIDFYKAIENTTLNEIGISEINHTKTLDNVVGSFNDTLNYKYILADYNGKAVYDTNKINIDYLVPSVRVSWLWQKIFEYFNFTYSGAVFNTFNFTNLWMTFPKGALGLGAENDVYINNNTRFESFAGIFSGINSLYFHTDGSSSLDNIENVINEKHFQVSESGLYRIKIEGRISPTGNTSGNLAGINSRIFIAKNATGISNANNVLETSDVLKESIGGNYNETYEVASEKIISLNALDSFCIVIRKNSGDNLRFVTESSSNPLKIKVVKIESPDIDFEGAFIDFKTKDFVNEILWRFGLTPYKDKYSNNIEFLTLKEVLQDTNVENWTDKLDSVSSEKYIYGNYAKENTLSYKYNDENSDYYNGTINIDNENLEDNKTIIASSIYAPEKNKTDVLGKLTNVYKLWDKEPKDDGTINYKSLDKRFYFLRSDNYNFGVNRIIGSEALTTQTTIVSAPFESYFKLPFNDIVQDYYLNIYQILNRSKLNNINVFLNEIDIQNLDFKKLYYFKQLGNYFLLNKVNNFTKKGITKCEFIKVDYVPPFTTDGSTYPLGLSFSGTCFTIENFEDFTNLLFQFSTDNGDTWTNGATFIFSNPSCGYVNGTGLDVLFRVINLSEEVLSNTILIPA